MKFTETRLSGVFLVELEPHEDERGFFARTFCVREFEQHGLVTCFVQCSTSFSIQQGTLRGLHFQLPPDSETKLVRCTGGAIFDVVVDLRPDSPTYLQHFAVELTANNRLALYVPEMFAHGFQTLQNDTEVFYQIDRFHSPGKGTGLRYDDPQLSIDWPLTVTAISDKDRQWPLLEVPPQRAK